MEKYGSFGSLLAAPEHRLKGVLIESNASDDDTFKHNLSFEPFKRVYRCVRLS